MRLVGLFLTLSGLGCGRFNFDPGAPAPDASGDAYRDLIVGDTPIAYWRLAETSGSTAVDEMGNTDGVYIGDCERGVTGAFPGNTAVKFAPILPRCMVTFGASFEIPARDPFTVEAWIAPTDAFPFGHVFSRQVRDDVMPLEGYAILESPDGMYAERVVGSANQSTLTSPIEAGVFSHVAMVYTGDSLTVIVNGIAGLPKPDTAPATLFVATAMIGCSTLSSLMTSRTRAKPETSAKAMISSEENQSSC